jgi:glycosyltransferase involved in cell wall biosynthesis
MVYVGSNAWYKNRAILIDIFSFLVRHRDLYLVIAGSYLDDSVNRIVEYKGLTSRVIQLGELTNDELSILYSGSEGLIFPSIAEGFGWPILEAQACGCPVFASDRAPMTEIGGNAAVYFDPLKPEDAAETIHQNLENSNNIRSRGYINCARFSVSSMLDGYVEIYSDLQARSNRTSM